MSVRKASIKLIISVYHYVAENQPVTIRWVKNHFRLSKQHTHHVLTTLRENGYLSYTGVQGATPAKYYVTDKPFDIELPKPAPKPTKSTKTPCKTKPIEFKTVEIEIKPDLAAMWLVKSKPHSVKRSIPIVRSIGLGVRQGTSLR